MLAMLEFTYQSSSWLEKSCSKHLNDIYMFPRLYGLSTDQYVDSSATQSFHGIIAFNLHSLTSYITGSSKPRLSVTTTVLNPFRVVHIGHNKQTCLHHSFLKTCSRLLDIDCAAGLWIWKLECLPIACVWCFFVEAGPACLYFENFCLALARHQELSQTPHRSKTVPPLCRHCQFS